MNLLELHVSSLEKFVDQVEKPSITDFSREYLQKRAMVNIVKKSCNVSLDYPVRSLPCGFQLNQCRVTTSLRSETVRSVLKDWFIHCLQQEPYALLVPACLQR